MAKHRGNATSHVGAHHSPDFDIDRATTTELIELVRPAEADDSRPVIRVSVRAKVARAEHRIRLLNEARDAALLVALGFATIVVVVMGVVLAWAGMADLPLEPTLKLTIDFVVAFAIAAVGAVLLWCASRLALWLVAPQPVLT